MSDSKKTDPKKRAVAIKYNPQDAAPKVVAKGKGHMADRIIDRAKDSNVKVYKDAELVKEFESINLDEHVPPELYEAVAKVLIFITDLDKRYEKFNY
ncbi:MAG: EscU/YscU/HrcU family type III secretion system export apparatus switch protein [Defluviitaleaceae bacterium]|nr:EscU/YscU/HrcU family type III secretion system export apparatus switch protein [Defluviitaleaceae bacterium]